MVTFFVDPINLWFQIVINWMLMHGLTVNGDTIVAGAMAILGI